MSEKLSTAWTEAMEGALVKLVEDEPILWKCRKDEDVGEEEQVKLRKICERLNGENGTGFTEPMVTKKWLELAMLFDLKFMINGCTMADRGQTRKRDGTIIADLTERWVHFHNLSFLIGSRKKLMHVVKKE